MERALPCYSGWMATDQIWWVSNEDNCFYQLFFCFKAGLVNIKLCLLPLRKNWPEFGTNWRDLSNCDCNRTTSDYHFIFKSYSNMKYKMLSFSLIRLEQDKLGKSLSACPHLYLGIAQIAITPPPRTQTGTLGHFFQARFYHFTILFTIFSE